MTQWGQPPIVSFQIRCKTALRNTFSDNIRSLPRLSKVFSSQSPAAVFFLFPQNQDRFHSRQKQLAEFFFVFRTSHNTAVMRWNRVCRLYNVNESGSFLRVHGIGARSERVQCRTESSSVLLPRLCRRRCNTGCRPYEEGSRATYCASDETA